MADLKPSITLEYKAFVSQSTGEDWKDVSLSLSTAKPLQGANIPRLQPKSIDVKIKEPMPVMYSRVFAASRSRSPSPQRIINEEESREPPTSRVQQSQFTLFGAKPPETPSFFKSVTAQLQERAVSTMYTIPGLSSIPHSLSDQKHKVSIARIQLYSVELTWITVPSEIPSVFLQCNVKNTSDFLLLAGETNIFMNNNFVAKSNIKHVSPQESFSCSLGVDAAIKVTYHPQSKKHKKTGGSFNVGSQKKSVTSYQQNITIRNTRLTILPTLIVREQIFVSQDERIKVDLLEPKELKGETSYKSSGISVSKARWMQTDEDGVFSDPSPTGNKTNNGLFEWVCKDIVAGTKLDLNVAWDVIAPVGLDWNEIVNTDLVYACIGRNEVPTDRWDRFAAGLIPKWDKDGW